MVDLAEYQKSCGIESPAGIPGIPLMHESGKELITCVGNGISCDLIQHRIAVFDLLKVIKHQLMLRGHL